MYTLLFRRAWLNLDNTCSVKFRLIAPEKWALYFRVTAL